MKQPVLYVKLDLEDHHGIANGASTQGTKQKDVLFQVSKGQLKSMLDNFEDIN